MGALACVLAGGAILAAAASRRFVSEDISATSGIRFSGENGASAEKMMIETMGSGVAVLDYDGDGRPDLVFVNGGGRPGSAAAGHDRLALYRNLGNDKFEDRTVVNYRVRTARHRLSTGSRNQSREE
jgi:FG-GAP repeat